MRFDISKGQILAISSNTDVYRRGEIYFYEGRVDTIDAKYDHASATNRVAAQVRGEYMEYFVQISITDDSVVKSYACNCNANTIWRGACKHVIAVLFRLSSALVQNRDQQLRGQAAGKIIKAFEKNSYDDANDELNKAFGNETGLRLEPEICFGRNNSIALRLSIGRDRMYVVKNIRELIMNIRTEAIVSYGKNLSVKHSVSALDEYSRSLFEICDKHYNAVISMQYAYRGVNLGYAIERDMPISPRTLDDIFEISIGRHIYTSVDNRERLNTLATTEPIEPLFKISDTDGFLSVSAKVKNYFVVSGGEYSYYLYPGRMHRADSGCAKAIAPFAEVFTTLKKDYVEFDKDNRRYFFSFVYPLLQKYGLVEESHDLAVDTEFIPDKKLYFDCEGKKISCRVEFVYGGTAYNPLKTVPGRSENKVEEFKIIKMLGMLGFEPDKVKGRYTLSDEDQIYDLYAGGLETVRNLAEVYVTDAFSSQNIVTGSRTKVGIRISGDLLRVNVDTAGYSLSELMEAVVSYNIKKKYHRLKDGRFISLEDEGVSAAAELLSTFDVSKKDVRNDALVLPKYRAVYLERLLDENTRLNTSFDDEFKKLTGDLTVPDEAAFAPPDGIASILRPYQATGHKWLKTLAHYKFGGILADDMGLGKTIQVISLLLSEEAGCQSLVVTPTSLMYNWAHEISRFAPKLKTTVVSGVPAKRLELLETGKDTDVLITTYDMLKRDIDAYEKMSFRYVIADEAQYIKNPGTQNAISVKRIKCDARFALTGTPIENSLSELWSIFDFVMPGYLYTSTKFTKLYETPIIKNDDKDRAKRLQHQISPFIMRRLKRDVLSELPDKVETTLYAEMYPEQHKIYLANLLKAQGVLEDALESGEFSRNKLQILSQITRLRQVSCHPSLFIEGYTGGSGKLDLTVETILSATSSGHRVLLFSQFTSMLKILSERLDQNSIEYFYLDGSTPAERRAKMAGEFNAGDKQVFLISLKAGGTGLNLIGADVVIHYDQWWNPAVMNQATDRAHRIGQEKIVQVINVVSKDSIEEKILELQAKKKDLVDSVLSEGENFISQMTTEEIKSLFVE